MVTHYYQLPPEDGILVQQGPKQAKRICIGELVNSRARFLSGITRSYSHYSQQNCCPSLVALLPGLLE
jgi:hypothetical protein